MTDCHSTTTRRVIKSKIAQKRRIKVQTTFYGAADPNSRSRRIPWINIRGHWLEAAGFTINTPVQIHVMDGCLVFTIES